MKSAVSGPSPSAIAVLLRGINNVGSRRVAMSALKSAFESMGFKNVGTVLASGNVIVDAPQRGPDMGRTITLGLEKALGFPVKALIRTVQELRSIVRSEPFKALPSRLDVQQYVTFLDGKGTQSFGSRLPAPPIGVKIVRVDPGEIYSVVMLSRGGRTPDLMRYLDRTLGRGGTTRNWRTVLKIVDRKA